MNKRWRDKISRMMGIMYKEFIQMRRNKATFAMMVGIPLIQLIFFGFAINFNPRHLPAAIVGDDHSVFTRKILTTLEHSSYFRFVSPSVSANVADEWLRKTKIQFVVRFPADFSHDLAKGRHPKLLLEVDATDPAASSNAIAVFNELPLRIFKGDARGPLNHLTVHPLPYSPIVHAAYNPLAVTSYNIVPGLLGVVLTMTMVVITAVAITREYERGTMENLLSMPVNAVEVILGKLIPYILVGYIQVLLILFFAKLFFGIPIQGSIFLLLLLCFPFIVANLGVGLMFSTLATDQLQATQSAMFFFLPSLLLSGFMFPFRGMPVWAQYLGEIFPLTHFLIIVRGIVLKGATFLDVWHEMVPILLFGVLVIIIGVLRYRQTLD